MPDVRRLGALVLYQAELTFSVGMTKCDVLRARSRKSTMKVGGGTNERKVSKEYT
jgi:hypothetical protein